MSDDLTARLRQRLQRELAEDLTEYGVPGNVQRSLAGAIAPGLAEVVYAYISAETAHLLESIDSQKEELLRLDGHLHGCRQARATAERERDEAVRLLEKAADIIDNQRAAFISDGAFGQARAEIVALQQDLMTGRFRYTEELTPDQCQKVRNAEGVVHFCDLLPNHEGPHHCIDCGRRWRSMLSGWVDDDAKLCAEYRETAKRTIREREEEILKLGRALAAVIEDHDLYSRPRWSSTAIEMGRKLVADHKEAQG